MKVNSEWVILSWGIAWEKAPVKTCKLITLSYLQVRSKADYVTADGKSRSFHSADFVDILVPLTVTESSIFGENWYGTFFIITFSFILFRKRMLTIYHNSSIYLKVEASCNGNIPARVLGSCLEPSASYEIENQSVNENWDLVSCRSQWTDDKVQKVK
jgi:hypothetical protein